MSFINWKGQGVAAGLLAGAALTGCVIAEAPEPVNDQRTSEGSGMALTMDILSDTDVAGMRYGITRTSCDGESYEPWETEVDVDLQDLLLPGGLDEFEDQPLDGDSAHLFADYFVVVPAGCYDVQVTPIQEDGTSSEDCATANMSGVEVEDGETTEILLVSQCDGPENGALDTVAVLNHPPVIDSLTYNPSKFTRCAETVEICATASDADGDPLEFVWSSNGPEFTVGEAITDGDSVTQCATVTPDEGGTYALDLTVYDLFVEDGELVRAEDWLQARGEDVESNDTLSFPLHVQCEEAECEEPNACGECGPTPEEVCDGEDNDCDGEIDEDLVCLSPQQCPIVLDFDVNGEGQLIAPGSNVNESYANYGVHIVPFNDASMETPGLGVAFDSSNPIDGYEDLGTPNEAFGGPGEGAAGGSNDEGLNNVLISSASTAEPLFIPWGEPTWFIFAFEEPVCIESFDLIDVDEHESQVSVPFFNREGDLIDRLLIDGEGDNSVQTIEPNVCGVSLMMIDLIGAGAIDNVTFCPVE